VPGAILRVDVAHHGVAVSAPMIVASKTPLKSAVDGASSRSSTNFSHVAAAILSSPLLLPTYPTQLTRQWR
jgi:hypothetical protein